jgi:D-glycero-alpha-D-manno-heptose-7-phosphate kinase
MSFPRKTALYRDAATPMVQGFKARIASGNSHPASGHESQSRGVSFVGKLARANESGAKPGRQISKPFLSAAIRVHWCTFAVALQLLAMIISKTPLRMSFVGGGSDLPVFYRKYGGAVVSTAINKFVYVSVNKKFDDRIRVSYSKTEEARSVDRIKHPLVRESMKLLGIDGGIEITSIADIPAKGSGLGSSSSFTVGVLHSLHAYACRYASAEQLARESCEIEIDRCGEPIGKQDQFAAAFGGFNFIEFYPDDSVSVEPIICKPETMQRLKANTLVFYTNITRSASVLLKTQQEVVTAEKAKQKVLCKMVELARQLKAELQKNNLQAFGEIIHENWELKRSLTSAVSNDLIDGWYARACKAGAIGGKLLGAGSGGFMMFYAPEERHEAIARELKSLRRMDFGFEPQGSKIIFVHD